MMQTTTEALRLSTPDATVPDVRAVAHRPSRPAGAAVLLVHGAGGDLDDAGLTALAEALAAHGHLAVRANLPYREAGRKAPPRADRAVPDLEALATSARDQLGPRRAWVVGGKSYGGRVASMAVAEGLVTAGLLFYSYPLHAPGKADRLRVEHWPQITVPCLFLHGTRDPFSEPGLLEANLRHLGAASQVEVVEGGDHSLRVAGKHAPDGRPQRPEVVLTERAARVAHWLGDIRT